MMANKGSPCIQCHAIGQFKPTGGEQVVNGPDLRQVATRFRPGYLETWIANPKRLVPYTAMPQNIVPHGTPQIPVPKTFENQPIEMVRAIRDTLLNYTNVVEQQLAGAKPAAASQPGTPPAAQARPSQPALPNERKAVPRTRSAHRPLGRPQSKAGFPPLTMFSILDPGVLPGRRNWPAWRVADGMNQGPHTRRDAMMTCWIRKPAILGLSLAATLATAMVGLRRSGDRYGRRRGRAGRHGDFDIDTVGQDGRHLAGNDGPRQRPHPARRAAAPVKAEGWGTLKGQVVFGGDPPTPKVLAEKGKAAKDPEVCAKDAPLVSERLVVDGATKGVKNVLVYLSKPTRRQR